MTLRRLPGWWRYHNLTLYHDIGKSSRDGTERRFAYSKTQCTVAIFYWIFAWLIIAFFVTVITHSRQPASCFPLAQTNQNLGSNAVPNRSKRDQKKKTEKNSSQVSCWSKAAGRSIRPLTSPPAGLPATANPISNSRFDPMAAALSSSRRALHTLHRRLLLHPSPSPAAARRALPTLTPTRTPIPAHSPTPTFSFSSSSRFSTTARPDARLRHGVLPQGPQQRLVGGVRSVASGGSKLAPLGQGVKGLGRPVEAARSAAARYRAAVGLQVEAFWRRNYMVLVGAGAVIVCVALWRIMFGIASTFVGLSEGMAKYGFLALATAIVAFAVSSIPFLVGLGLPLG